MPAPNPEDYEIVNRILTLLRLQDITKKEK